MGNIVYAANKVVEGQTILNIAYGIIYLCIFIGIISAIVTFIKNRHDVKTIRIKRRKALMLVIIMLVIICGLIVYSIPLMKSLIN